MSRLNIYKFWVTFLFILIQGVSLASSNFFELISNLNYKFKDGPFSNTIFKLIGIKNKKIEILLGDLRTKVDKNKFLISPI